MAMLKKLLSGFIFIAVFFFAAWGVVQNVEAQKIMMRVGTPTTNDPQTYEMNEFKKVVEKNSNGRIEVRLFPSGQLGSNSQMLQGLQAGTIHGLLEPTAFLGGFCNALTMVDLPYYFPDVRTATKLLNGPSGDILREYLEKRGLVAGSYYTYGDRILLLKFPVNDMSSFKGKKVRVMGAKVLQDEINSWGGVGIPMDVPELYTALQQGVIDGLGSAAQFFFMLKYHQVAKYIFTEPKGAEVTIFMMNKKWLDELPADLRKVVLDGAKEIQPEAERYASETEKKALEGMKAAGVTIIDASPSLRSQLQAASQSVHETFLKENPDVKPIYDSFKKAMTAK
jgi:C4-dicarboxylate-binding protein DctP